MTPEQVRAIPDPVQRFHLAGRLNGVHDLHATAIRKGAARELYRELSSWKRVGNRLGVGTEQARRLGSR